LWIQTLQRNELANFETKFGTFVQKLNEIDCKSVKWWFLKWYDY
jgi:hypothetical protein